MSVSDVSEFFPPSDRELALRGVIHHGWSTVAAKQGNIKDTKISPKEVAIIQDVLLKAQAIEKAEEIRVGLFMLKHQQLVKSCRGDGVVSCRICGIYFASQKTGDGRRPSGVQLCHICQMGICHRCKTLCRSGTSEVIQILCLVCANQKELWRRSGAWLSNIEPKMSLDEDELLKIQEQQDIAYNRSQTTLSKSGSLPREFINPGRLDDSSSDSDDNEIGTVAIDDPKLDFTKPQDNSGTSTLKFSQELKEKSKSPPVSQTLPWSFRSSKSPEHKVEKTIPRSLSAGHSFPKDTSKRTDITSSLDSKLDRSKGSHRRTAISSRDKGKMEESRQRAKMKRESRSSSSTSGNEGAMGDCSSSCKEETASPSPVHVPTAKPRASERPLSSHDSSETEYENSPSRDIIEPDKKPEMGSLKENTPHTSPLRRLRKIDRDSSAYATVEFNKPPETTELFAKVTTKRSPTTESPKALSEVTYSQVDFTKTAPKPPNRAPPKLQESDNVVEFAKVKSRATVVAETAVQRKGLETITEESPPLPRRRRETAETEASPKIPSRSESLKRKSMPSSEKPSSQSMPGSEEPPPPPVRTLSSESRQRKVLPDLPSVDPPSPTAAPPVPRARARIIDDTMIKVTPPTPRGDGQFKPPLPDKEQSKQLPSLPDKEQPPLPAKESTKPTRKIPPLPAKDESDKPPLPQKERPEMPKKDPPELPQASRERVQSLKDKPKRPPPQLPKKDRPELPQKDKPQLPTKDRPQLPTKDTPELPQKDRPELPQKDRPQLPMKDKPELPTKEKPQLPMKESNETASLSPADASQPGEGAISRGTKVRSTISNKAVMGSLLSEFQKKREQLSPADREKSKSPDLSDSEVSPNASLRRRNARRSARSSKSNSGDDSNPNLPTSGEDGANEENFRSRTRSKAFSEPQEPELGEVRTRTRSSAVSETRSRVRSDALGKRPARPIRRNEIKSTDGLSPSDEGSKVTPRPRSHSPAPDGM